MRVHVLDYWFSDSRPIRSLQIRMLNQAVRRGGRGAHMSTSPSMQQFMKEKLSIPNIVISNCCDFPEEPRKVSPPSSSGLSILYAGNLTPNRYVTLSMLAAEIQKRGLTQLTMDVYAPQEQVDAFAERMDSSIHLHPAVAAKEVAGILAKADVLLHAESFKPADRKFAMYSLSTKIAEYVSVLKPIVYYGPMEIGVARFLSEYGIGLASDDVDFIVSGLQRLMEDPSFYLQHIHTNLDKSRELFGTPQVQRRLFECLGQKG